MHGIVHLVVNVLKLKKKNAVIKSAKEHYTDLRNNVKKKYKKPGSRREYLYRVSFYIKFNFTLQ